MQANEFEGQFVNNNDQTNREHGENIVQLGCNPAHVFHAECIESFVFCPECFVPIDNEVPASFIEERSEEQDGDEEEGGEEYAEENDNLLDRMERDDQAQQRPSAAA